MPKKRYKPKDKCCLCNDYIKDYNLLYIILVVIKNLCFVKNWPSFHIKKYMQFYLKKSKIKTNCLMKLEEKIKYWLISIF